MEEDLEGARERKEALEELRLQDSEDLRALRVGWPVCGGRSCGGRGLARRGRVEGRAKSFFGASDELESSSFESSASGSLVFDSEDPPVESFESSSSFWSFFWSSSRAFFGESEDPSPLPSWSFKSSASLRTFLGSST